jgi:hypothetical protein
LSVGRNLFTSPSDSCRPFKVSEDVMSYLFLTHEQSKTKNSQDYTTVLDCCTFMLRNKERVLLACGLQQADAWYLHELFLIVFFVLNLRNVNESGIVRAQ